MLEVVMALAVGALIGRLGRSSPLVAKTSSLLTGWGVVLLLFCMGLGIGSNASVMQNLPILGGQALLLMLGSVGGAFLLSLPLSLYLKRRHVAEEGQES